MFKISVLFWIACLAAIVWGGWVIIALGVSASYHPMAANGDALFTLKMLVMPLAALVGVVMYVMWSRRRPLAARTYGIGVGVLAIIAALPILPRVDSGYQQVAYLGDEKYEIPWQYDPSSFSDQIGGEVFRVRVALPDMAPSYRSLSETIRIGKAVDYNFGRGGDAPETPCSSTTYTTQCEWQIGDFVYTVSGDNDDLPEDKTALLEQAVELLDGFRASMP